MKTENYQLVTNGGDGTKKHLEWNKNDIIYRDTHTTNDNMLKTGQELSLWDSAREQI